MNSWIGVRTLSQIKLHFFDEKYKIASQYHDNSAFVLTRVASHAFEKFSETTTDPLAVAFKLSNRPNWVVVCWTTRFPQTIYKWLTGPMTRVKDIVWSEF